MYIEAKLVWKSYKPLYLEKGMFFLTRRGRDMVIYQMQHVPVGDDVEKYLQLNGYPVEPFIIEDGNPNVSSDQVIYASPEQIGWWDVGEQSDELYDITIKEIENIMDNDGYVMIEVEDEPTASGRWIPVLFQGKVTLRDATYFSPEEDEHDEYEEEEEEYEEEYEDDDAEDEIRYMFQGDEEYESPEPEKPFYKSKYYIDGEGEE